MTAETIRLECLRLATMTSNTRASAEQVLDRARAYLAWVLPGDAQTTKRGPKSK